MNKFSILSLLKGKFGRKADNNNLEQAIKILIGKKPNNPDLFRLATLHSSAAIVNAQGIKESNERLEFLGDAILDLIVSEYLFKKFPYKHEGFLTDIRARIVNRNMLNDLALKLGINKLVEFDNSIKSDKSPKSIYGNTLEAIVGAVYLDRGYKFCRQFVINKLILPHFDMEKIVKIDPNQKSKIIEWAQKENKELRFEIINIREHKNKKEFTAQIFVDNKPLAKGFGLSKKKAEQDAAHKSCEILNLD